ncbi:MAG: putative bifunctional diguanylate cyclase/phosphodiesterase [Acidimicrobiales bacterium]
MESDLVADPHPEGPGVGRIPGTADPAGSPDEPVSELRAALSLLRATLDATADGILVVDRHGTISRSNNQFFEMWGIPDAIRESRDDEAALAFVLDQLVDADGFLTKVRDLYATPEAESFDTLKFKDGRVFERYSKPQVVGDQVVGRVWSFRDVTERKRLEEELAHQAFHDSLTNLANKALFRDRVQHAVARMSRRGGRLAVLFLDLDNFKTINDSLGHPAGDQLLGAATERLLACLRSADTAARLGGDEFALLLEDADTDAAAVDVAERVIAALSLPFLVRGKEVTISVSVGIAFHSPDLGPDELLSNADLAMYTAKSRGKARYEVFQTHMHEAAVERLEVEAQLRRATREGGLTVHYQPIVDLPTGSITAVEALARWQHPTRGVLSADSFIPLAEETSLVQEVDRYVLGQACRQARRWQLAHAAHRCLAVGVNVSARQVGSPGLVGEVVDALGDSGLSAEDLLLEITERAIMTDADAAVRNLKDLKGLGVRLAIDDFGTGFSSLTHLKDFPIDILKIDRSFVTGMGDPSDSALGRAILGLARTLELTAIAEGVETRQQVGRLTASRCELAQGYFFSPPLDAAALDGVLSDGRLLPGTP